MAASTREWLVVLIFFLFTFGLIFLEAAWLSKKNWASFGKSLAFALASDITGFFVAGMLMFAAAMIIFMFVWDGAIDKYRNGDALIIAVIVLANLVSFLFLAFCKRLFLKILKIRTGKTAWIYSFAGAFIIALLWLGVPALAAFLFAVR